MPIFNFFKSNFQLKHLCINANNFLRNTFNAKLTTPMCCRLGYRTQKYSVDNSVKYKNKFIDSSNIYGVSAKPIIRNVQNNTCCPLYLINHTRYFSKTNWNSNYSGNRIPKKSIKQKSTLYYIIAVGILSVGLSYAAVPLYRIFCQAYSYGGTIQQEQNSAKIQSMERKVEREITIRFNADTASSMTWNFKPQQTEIKLTPGETALAFYSACNPTDKQVTGVSTYNVVPFDAGQYFNKIQCFCFEEQMLNPKEEVSMPVFFYIDPEFADDPKMEYVNEITLSYTFFEVKEGLQLPFPNFAK